MQEMSSWSASIQPLDYLWEMAPLSARIGSYLHSSTVCHDLVHISHTYIHPLVPEELNGCDITSC